MVANATLVCHRGAREVTREQLSCVACPPPEGNWRPVPHLDVLTHAEQALTAAGYGIDRMSLALSGDDARFFGTLTLRTPLSDGVNLAVGLRSSIDKSIALQWCCGSRVFVCDNLAFTAQTMITRKHMRECVRFQVDDDEAAEPAVVEEQIDPVPRIADAKAALASNECEVATQLQQESFQVKDQGFFDFGLGVFVFEAQKLQHQGVFDLLLGGDLIFGLAAVVPRQHGCFVTAERRALVENGADLAIELLDRPASAECLRFVKLAGEQVFN